MKKPAPPKKKSSPLRKRAEASLKKQTGRLEDLSSSGMKTLIHDLGTHQIELEMQNEELRRAQEELEISRRKYADLYDLAPVGYLTIDEKGSILEANLTAATMLSTGKRFLLNKRFDEFLDPKDRGLFMTHSAEVLENRVQRSLEVRIRNSRKKSAFWTLLESAAVENPDEGTVSLRTAMSNIEERKRAEDDLRKSNAFNQSIIDSSSDCIKLLDLDGRLQYMSPSGQRLLEIKSFGDYANMPYSEFWKGTDREQVIAAINKAKQGLSSSFQGYCPTAAGTPKWWDVSISPVLGAGGKPERLLAVSRDVTEHRRAERALRESEERFKAIAENTAVGIGVVDAADQKFLYANAAYHAAFGYSLDELMGRKAGDVYYDPEDRSRILQTLKDQGRVTNYEVRLKRKDGSVFWSSSTIRPISFSGKPALIGAFIDVTERKNAEEALRRSEALFRSLTESSPDCIALHDRELRHLYVSPAITRLSGLPEEAFIGKTVGEAGLPPAAAAELERLLRRVLETGSEHFGEFIFPSTGGDVYFHWRSVPVWDADGSMRGVLAIASDITARRRAEEKLQESVRELRAANDELARFNRAAVDRELRMIELKKEINEMLQRTGDAPRYHVELEKE